MANIGVVRSITQTGTYEPFELQVARGQITGHEVINIFGYNPDVDTSEESVWPEPTAGKPQPPLEDKPVSLQHLANVTPEQRLDMIREAAYYRAEKRNFAEGNDAQDWADAEREIDELTAKAKEIFGSR